VVGTSSPGTILDIRQTQTGGETKVSVFNTDTADTTTQTASIGLSPDSRASAIAGIEAIKVNADFSTNAGRDVELALNTTLNNAKKQAVYITHGGNVGIGTTIHTRPLVVSKSEAEGIEFGPGESANVNLTLHFNRNSSVYTTNEIRASDHTFYIGSSEKARIDSSGRLLVGTTSVTDASLLTVDGNSVSNTGQAVLSLRRGGAPSATTHGLGYIQFSADGDNYGAFIQALNDGTWTSGSSHPGRLVFSTTADGASSPTERVRIESNGKTKFSGGVYGIENPINTGTGGMDLNDGNFWTCAGITIPLPTNGVAGMSGLIRVTAAPTFATGWDFPGGTYTAPTAFPAIAPFYIVNSSTFLLGNWTEGIT